MAQGSNVTVTVRRPPREVMDVIRAAGKRNFTAFLETFEEVAKELSPHDTGNNKDSIHAEGSWANSLMFDMKAYTESGYGAYLELGTSKKASTEYTGGYRSGQWRPYFAPAFRIAAAELARTQGKDWE